MQGAKQTGGILGLAEQYKDETVILRRWFHAHPEPSLKEYITSNRIKQELDKLGIPFRSAGETGIVGIIEGNASASGNRQIVGLRADIDALEIQEQNDVEYISLNRGLMHACGHDSHIASLLTAARILVEEKANLEGTVKLIFQPAEEIGHGAEIIIKSGLISDVDAFFGIHVTPSLPTGQVSVIKGPIMAGANSLRIVVNGQSGHGGRPNQAIDAIVAGCAIVGALQQVVSREVDPILPAVVTVGMFQAGTRANIIANRADIYGTVRVITEESRKQIAEAIKRIVRNTAAVYRVQAEVECEYATPIVINDDTLYGVALRSVGLVLSEKAVVELPITMGTDDFAVFNNIAPTFYMQVGTNYHPGGSDISSLRNGYPLHHERFNIDEDCLPVSSALYVEFAHQYLRYRE